MESKRPQRDMDVGDILHARGLLQEKELLEVRS